MSRLSLLTKLLLAILLPMVLTFAGFGLFSHYAANRALEAELADAMNHPASTDAEIAELKRKKLKIKERTKTFAWQGFVWTSAEKKDFIDNIEYGGASTFMAFAGETDICLFI